MRKHVKLGLYMRDRVYTSVTGLRVRYPNYACVTGIRRG